MNFGEVIKARLKKDGYPYKTRYEPAGEFFIRGKTVIRDYDKVTIYSGKKIQKPATRRSSRLVAFKDSDGNWQGDRGWMATLCGEDGDKIYQYGYHHKYEQLKYVVYSHEWYENENQAMEQMWGVLDSWGHISANGAKIPTRPEKITKYMARLKKTLALEYPHVIGTIVQSGQPIGNYTTH